MRESSLMTLLSIPSPTPTRQPVFAFTFFTTELYNVLSEILLWGVGGQKGNLDQTVRNTLRLMNMFRLYLKISGSTETSLGLI